MNTKELISPEEWNHISENDRQAIAAAICEDNKRKAGRGEVIPMKRSFYVRYGKRMLDIVIGLVACIVLAPVNFLLAAITFLDVGSPILFRQERVGKDGKPFCLVKFRNMTNETNEKGILLPPEQRVTRWGRFVRRASLDELLNFWSILKGDMSVIGPRPLPKKYIGRFNTYHQQRHFVRPGLECPFHDPSLAVQGWQGRLDNDVWYVRNISLKTDVKMMLLLVKKVFSGKERTESAAGRTGEFIGYCEDGSVMNEWNIPRKYLTAVHRAAAGEYELTKTG